MPMYTSAAGKRAEADAFPGHCPAEALRMAATPVGDITFPPMGVWQGPVWKTQGPEPARPPPGVEAAAG